MLEHCTSLSCSHVEMVLAGPDGLVDAEGVVVIFGMSAGASGEGSEEAADLLAGDALTFGSPGSVTGADGGGEQQELMEVVLDSARTPRRSSATIPFPSEAAAAAAGPRRLGSLIDARFVPVAGGSAAASTVEAAAAAAASTTAVLAVLHDPNADEYWDPLAGYMLSFYELTWRRGGCPGTVRLLRRTAAQFSGVAGEPLLLESHPWLTGCVLLVGEAGVATVSADPPPLLQSVAHGKRLRPSAGTIGMRPSSSVYLTADDSGGTSTTSGSPPAQMREEPMARDSSAFLTPRGESTPLDTGPAGEPAKRPLPDGAIPNFPIRICAPCPANGRNERAWQFRASCVSVSESSLQDSAMHLACCGRQGTERAPLGGCFLAGASRPPIHDGST